MLISKMCRIGPLSLLLSSAASAWATDARMSIARISIIADPFQLIAFIIRFSLLSNLQDGARNSQQKMNG
jgi:hypothetical protein